MSEAVVSISDKELTVLWRTEQVLHAVARVMREGKLSIEALGFEYLAVCECAERTQELAVRVQREKMESGDGCGREESTPEAGAELDGV